MSKDPCSELLSQYTFSKPTETLAFYTVKAKHRETSQPYTIKVFQKASDQLYQYLSKMKDAKSEYVTRIHDIARSSTQIVMVCQDISSGTLQSALQKCKRLEQNDALLVCKNLLQGRIDLLRGDCDWRGTEKDIDITDSGVKLSWNNGGESVTSSTNPFPELIKRIALKPEREQGGILPFPKNKNILDLIKVSVENASEMSLHPLLKKKQKILKKKGKGWVAIRQFKSKSEYFEETVYFAVSPTHGFIRVKIYENGHIDRDIKNLYRSNNPNFVRILDFYEQNNSYVILSDYANDGNVQNYVTRLKSSNILLKEDQIEFILYSLIEPLKQVQKSAIKSLNYIHIRNIYLENGIPKIGQPVPMTLKMEEMFRDRADVPDFYHPRFKNNPQTREPEYDTYSLGILLYKLMYTEYPIFPEQKVHVPTTPNYNQRIKQNLLIFLNEGGKLADLEARIEVSEAVKQQIQANKVILNKEAASLPKPRESVIELQDIPAQIKAEKSCWQRLFDSAKDDPNPPQAYNKFFVDLENSSFRKYRITTKIILTLILYIFLFYLNFLVNSVNIFSRSTLLQKYNITIGANSYTVITSDSFNLDSQYNISSPTITTITQNLKCLIDVRNNYSSFVNSKSGMWYGYLSAGLLLVILILIGKSWQISAFDLTKAIQNYQKAQSNYNISRWIIHHLISALVIYAHYFFFNFIFYEQTSPCLGGDQGLWFKSTQLLFNDKQTLMATILPVSIAILVLGLLSFLQVLLYQRIKYSKLVNPIVILLPIYTALTIMTRIGAYIFFVPSAIDRQVINNTISKNHVGLFGFIPQLLVIGQLIIGFLVDWLFFRFFERKMQNMFPDEPLPQDSMGDIRV